MSERKTRILFVDDDVAFSYAVYRFLESKGYQVKTATGPKEAFDLLKRDTFDIVVTDIKFGRDEPDGLELTAFIKQKRPTFPVICVTAYPELVNVAPALDVIVLYKPLELSALQNAIEALAA